MTSSQAHQQPEQQHLLRRRSLSQSSLLDPGHMAIPDPFTTKRSVSYLSLMDTQASFRIRIRYQDEALRLRAQANSRQLIQSALDETETAQLSNSARIAKKALKYRKVLDRMAGIDVNDPQFDASEFLGVYWCKTIIVADTTPCAGPRVDTAVAASAATVLS